MGYAIMGALFMPFLAGTLIVLNGKKKWVGELVNSKLTNSLLWLSLVLFGYLAVVQIVRQF